MESIYIKSIAFIQNKNLSFMSRLSELHLSFFKFGVLFAVIENSAI